MSTNTYNTYPELIELDNGIKYIREDVERNRIDMVTEDKTVLATAEDDGTIILSDKKNSYQIATVSKSTTKKKRERKKEYDKGYRNMLIKLLLSNGVVVTSGLDMLPGHKDMYRRKMREMKKEGVVEIIRREGVGVARIINFEKNYDTYISSLPNGYYGYFNQHAKTNTSKINLNPNNPNYKSKIIRVIRESELSQLMINSNIGVLLEEKIELTSDIKIGTRNVAYYTMSELDEYIKFELGVNTESEHYNNVMTTRAYGLLISPGGKYAVYHTGKALMQWRKSSEGQVAHYFSRLINEKCEEPRTIGHLREAIMIMNNPKMVIEMFNPKNNGSIRVNCGYERMYCIPYNEEGSVMLSIMTNDGWREWLRDYYLEGYSANITGGITCDGIKDNKYAYLFCDGDIVRFNKFLSSVQWVMEIDKNYEFEVYCYEFQREIVKELSDNMVTIITVPILQKEELS